uniref:Uncharacterized protein n=1 Tax=Arundo donax TaxID=35708 RepID=A0A0A9BPA7_ARUDO
MTGQNLHAFYSLILLRKSRRSFLFVNGICPDSAALAWLSNY